MDTSTEKRSNRTLVVGLGNSIMTDDGAGLVALAKLQEEFDLPEDVDTLDGGTLGLELLVYMEGYPRILIADCVMGAGEKPGTVYKIEREDVPDIFERCLSPHQMGLKDLVNVMELQGRVPEQLVVIGVEGENIQLGTVLSTVVSNALPKMVKGLADELKSWGLKLSEKAA